MALPPHCGHRFRHNRMAGLGNGKTQSAKLEDHWGQRGVGPGLGIVSFWFPGSRWLWSIINDLVVAVLTASQKGTMFLLGPLALGPGQTLPDGTVSIGFILAAQALPAVVFFAALMAGLYYLGAMQAIVGLFARLFYRTMGLSGAESLSGAANIFVGIEAGLIVRPYLAAMTQSELLLVLTCMMATVASTVMGIYVSALQHTVPRYRRAFDFRINYFDSLCGAHQQTRISRRWTARDIGRRAL